MHFTCPALCAELNLNGCTSLVAPALAGMVRGAPRLRRLRADGCASLDGELSLASRSLVEVSAEGCQRLGSLRIAAPLQSLAAKNCRALTVGLECAFAGHVVLIRSCKNNG
jgi:hypothetical protein